MISVLYRLYVGYTRMVLTIIMVTVIVKSVLYFLLVRMVVLLYSRILMSLGYYGLLVIIIRR